MAKKHTKKALFTSVMSLVLCFAMLVGTTFAWFTDSVTSDNNIIQSGNLDVELYHSDKAATNEKVTSNVKLFDDVTLWEPGAVAYENLVIKNEGSLALTYQMALNFTNATINDNGRTLADVLKVAVVRGGFNGGREEAKSLTYDQTLSTFALKGDLRENQSSETFGVVVYWQPGSNDNAFNMNNGSTKIMSIDLGIQLNATQLEHEFDSFDNTYDQDAKLELPEVKVETPTADAFMTALTNGEFAVLTADLALDDGDFVIPSNVTSAIDLNGKTLTVGANGGIEVEGNLIVAGNGAIAVTGREGSTYAGFQVDEGATMEIGEGVTITTPSNTIGVWVHGNLIVDGATINAEAGSHGIFTHEGGNVDIIINSGSVTGDGDAIYIGWNVNADIVIGENATVGKIVGGYGGTTANITYYGDTTLNIAENAAETINLYNIRNVANDAELNKAITDGANEIILAGDEYTADLYVVPANRNLIISGQGAATKLNFKQGQVRLDLFDSLTISDLTMGRMVDKSWGQIVFGGPTQAGGVYTLSNCIFNGESTQGIYINNSVASTFNIENCVFNGDFGGEGAITIQDNDAEFTVNVNNCDFNNIPETSHDIYVANNPEQNSGNWTLNVDGERIVATAVQLADAVANGATNLNLLDGEYNVANCTDKNLTINGTENVVLMLYNEGEDGCDYGFKGSTVTFNGITINTTANTGNYKGYAYMNATFNDCNFVGAYASFKTNTFNNCTFDFQNGYFWTWGAEELTFNSCTFNGNSKTILAHGGNNTVINIKDCNFAATEKGYTSGGDNTAVVEIDPIGTNTYTINFTGENTKTDSYAGWTRVKDGSTGHTVTGI